MKVGSIVKCVKPAGWEGYDSIKKPKIESICYD
jgi:hypothetical protein